MFKLSKYVPACEGKIIPFFGKRLLFNLIFSSKYITEWSAASCMFLFIHISKKIFINFFKIISFLQL